MSIKHWPADDRPREKLLERGAQALSDAELLAIFLRVGVTGKSAVDLAREALQTFGSLTNLARANVEEFSQIKGFGAAKFVQLQAAVELSRRALSEQMASATLLNNPTMVKDYLRLTLGRERVESFVVLHLSAQNALLASHTAFRGTLTKTAVYPREIVKSALAHNSAAVIFAHNHPSGNAEPSQDDIALTATLKDALALVDVRVVDHFIVTATTCESLAERGLL
jgi:DNA repair protein RadC